MKNFTRSTTIILLFTAGCTSTKNTTDKGNAFTRAFAALESNKASAAAVKKAQDAYNMVQGSELNNITLLSASNDEQRWDGLVKSYATLQQMHQTVTSSQCCSQLIAATNYGGPLATTREAAAAYYYNKAENLAADTTVGSIRRAFAAYDKALGFVPGYRDAAEKRGELFSSNSFIVAFNPLEDSSFFAEMGTSAAFYNYSNLVFVETLIKELHTDKSSIPFLQVLKYSDCLQQGLTPDWMVDISLPQFNLPVSTEQVAGYVNETKQVGTDSTGRPIYQTFSVRTMTDCDMIDNATARLQLDITNAENGASIVNEKFDADNREYKVSTCGSDSRLYRNNQGIPTMGVFYTGYRSNATAGWVNPSISLKENAAVILYSKIYAQYKQRLKDILEN
jgi:hypothetical protein